MDFWNFNVGHHLGTDLSSRAVARNLRQGIQSHVHAGASVELYFDEVRSISTGFADELLGVLVELYGIPWFKKNVQVTGMSDVVRQIVLEAIAERLEWKRLEN